MAAKRLGLPLAPGQCKFRVICIHNAGSTESVWTGPGTPLVNWVKETKQVELIAPSFPGRDKMRKEPKIERAGALAEVLLGMLYEKLSDGIPFAFVAHSVGTWVTFEILMLMRKIGLPMPVGVVLNAFPSPDLPEENRPWHANRGMDETAFREEVNNWDRDHFGGRGKAVFKEPDWSDIYHSLMRADFRLFDEYKFMHAGAQRFSFPIHTWFCEQEHFNTLEMVRAWERWTTGLFTFETLPMGHLTALYDPDFKKTYLQKVTDVMRQFSEL